MSDKNRDSDSPILFRGISEAYLEAFRIIWRTEFALKHRFYWDKSQIMHPISQLLGVSIETSVKGLLSCAGQNVPRTHDLVKLVAQGVDGEQKDRIDRSLVNLEVPPALIEANPGATLEDIQSFYFRHSFHIEMLNNVYDRPFAARYPVLGGHTLPDPVALERVAKLLVDDLRERSRNWRPPR